MKNTSAAKLSLAAITALGSVNGFVHDVHAAVVINEVYGGGGSTTQTVASYSQDFVELYNNGLTAVDLTGLTVRYASSAGTFSTTSTSNVGVLNATMLAPGAFYVVAGASSATYVGGTLSNYQSTSNISASATAGKIALFGADGTTVLDLVGYGGTATTGAEGTAAAATTVTSSAMRIVDGVDTNNNSADFFVGTPTPGATNTPEPTTLGLAAVASALVLRRRSR